MKKKMIIYGFIAVAMLTTAFTVSPAKDLKSRLETLSGTYADAKPYQYGKAWGQRVFTFDKGKWTLVFTLSLDPGLRMQVFQFRTFGTYQVQDKSVRVPDTYNALFSEEKKFLTLKTNDENLIRAFGFSSCNLTKDKEQDISEAGCSGWKPVSVCSGDYDLLSLDKDGKLYFGNRPQDNDMCSPDKRPSSLTPPVTKVK
jgi:hypothetical protein